VTGLRVAIGSVLLARSDPHPPAGSTEQKIVVAIVVDIDDMRSLNKSRAVYRLDGAGREPVPGTVRLLLENRRDAGTGEDQQSARLEPFPALFVAACQAQQTPLHAKGTANESPECLSRHESVLIVQFTGEAMRAAAEATYFRRLENALDGHFEGEQLPVAANWSRAGLWRRSPLISPSSLAKLRLWQTKSSISTPPKRICPS
jgi:hypothetical protein